VKNRHFFTGFLAWVPTLLILQPFFGVSFDPHKGTTDKLLHGLFPFGLASALLTVGLIVWWRERTKRRSGITDVYAATIGCGVGLSAIMGLATQHFASIGTAEGMYASDTGTPTHGDNSVYGIFISILLFLATMIATVIYAQRFRSITDY
jgi:hypothetical protein